MTWVKVCGMRTVSDVDAAETAGSDAIGLVLIEESPRSVTVEQAAALAAHSPLPAIILTRDLSPHAVARLIEDVGAAGAQPYGQDAAAVVEAIAADGKMVLSPHRVRGPVDLDALVCTLETLEGAVVPLLDGYSSDALGGTGTEVPRAWLPAPGSRYVLAGGLSAHNVAEAIHSHGPWGVDASSGLESSLGVKDPDLILAFVKEAKTA